MTKLHAALGQRLPGSLSVGRGNALSLAGTCHAGTERIESLSVVANGVEAEVRAHGMPSPGTRDRTGTRWWGIVPHPGGHERLGPPDRASRTARRRQRRFRRAGRDRAGLRAVDTAGAAHGNGGATSSNGGNGHRTWHPKGGPVIAIAMTTHRPPMETLQAGRSSRSASRRTRTGSASSATTPRRAAPRRRCGRSSATTPLPLCPASDEQRGVYRNFERALDAGPAGGGVRRALRPGRPSGTRTSSQTPPRGARAAVPSSRTATCASSPRPRRGDLATLTGRSGATTTPTSPRS